MQLQDRRVEVEHVDVDGGGVGLHVEVDGATILDHRKRGLAEADLEEPIATLRWAPRTPCAWRREGSTHG
jgi:hypothetical protein